MKINFKKSYFFSYLILAFVTIVMVFPFYWMIVTSLSKPENLFRYPPKLWPDFQWKNYIDMWKSNPQGVPWTRYILNTIFVATTTTLLSLFNSSLAGFAFARLKFPLKNQIFMLILGIMMIPGELMLIPNYLTLYRLNWLNSYQALIIPFGASVFGTFLTRQAFKQIPNELWEAAQIDGCSIGRFYFNIALPIIKPTLFALALFVFLGAWNAFLWPLIVNTDPRFMPLEVALYSFIGAESTNWQLLAAAATMATTPVLILFLIFQTQFIEGISRGAIKG
ncbi:carbohydrate ABC transporter permease [Caldisericum exile]|uniref:ABC transporter permease protein n=1 Tax=Caldisericum exile (strain DSM 21853 / NBRC 104410 / AZM16c01) TaxID=511051 RepID=A0A7U6GFE0_CALEA|nr:carbohydrate ABC transporter permease [Caldisericum exile]BAL81388.1 putative ABC transporter permease protein [Caldisericum exile AZM16c01]